MNLDPSEIKKKIVENSKLKVQNIPNTILKTNRNTRNAFIQNKIYEIDLHKLDNIVDQLKLAEEHINIALKNGQKEIKIIHGIGEGKLKSAIHDLLKAPEYKKHISEIKTEIDALYDPAITICVFK